uniref:PCIF1 WW domain-containing protein n=1 Tax=Chromera velia CCMP2878 TaxID=1169474 RepID=A0A0G4GE53_9ALVE|eukprot:Cvel_628.t1-p1 / transcript=Cvel_628.t1 / gene=Cvel_628 / organism=Chromera_velia_CCMP2878 / gene_product=Phosphorylated CTD-interacting factor 1, putative / transcript_product=Phosphorylated CTD-interacting factor 1, putative / location=Cvel_scaffold19:111481-113777(-) / protein_length=650 / sequence_SO=supercontig / SO=protein_coding / is_pseudo=false
MGPLGKKRRAPCEGEETEEQTGLERGAVAVENGNKNKKRKVEIVEEGHTDPDGEGGTRPKAPGRGEIRETANAPREGSSAFRAQQEKEPSPSDPVWSNDLTKMGKVPLSLVASACARLPPAPEAAMLRLKKLKALRSKFHKACKKGGARSVPLLAFERWLSRAKLQESVVRREKEKGGEETAYCSWKCPEDVPEWVAEPVIPLDGTFMDRGLVSDLSRAGVSRVSGESVAREMAQAGAAAGQALVAAVRDEWRRGGFGESNGEGGLVDVVVDWGRRENERIRLFLGDTATKPYLEIAQTHLRKLAYLFLATRSLIDLQEGEEGGAVDVSVSEEEVSALIGEGGKNFQNVKVKEKKVKGKERQKTFYRCVWCVLAVYEAMGGAGFQAALPGDAFGLLKKKMSLRFECFGSPLNCWWPRFCSASVLTDSFFGSQGSFFDFRPSSGAFEANPPFVPEVMSSMVEHMEALLHAAEGPLLFFVIVPDWTPTQMWGALAASPFLLDWVSALEEMGKGKGKVSALEESQGDFGGGWMFVRGGQRKEKQSAGNCSKSTSREKGLLTLSGKSHGFCDGVQHVKSSCDRHRPSSFGTSLAVLRNEAGAARWDQKLLRRGAEGEASLFPFLKKLASGMRVHTESLEEWEGRGSSRGGKARG